MRPLESTANIVFPLVFIIGQGVYIKRGGSCLRTAFALLLSSDMEHSLKAPICSAPLPYLHSRQRRGVELISAQYDVRAWHAPLLKLQHAHNVGLMHLQQRARIRKNSVQRLLLTEDSHPAAFITWENAIYVGMGKPESHFDRQFKSLLTSDPKTARRSSCHTGLAENVKKMNRGGKDAAPAAAP